MYGSLIFTLYSIILTAESYVIVQVKKGEELSNVDAVIHKKIPSDRLGEFTDRLSQLGAKVVVEGENKDDNKKIKRFEVRKRINEGNSGNNGYQYDNAETEINNLPAWDGGIEDSSNFVIETNDDKKKLESILVHVDSGVNPAVYSTSSAPDSIDKIHQVIGELVSKTKSPSYRAQDELSNYNIKPEVVHFKASNPAMKYEINSESIVKAIQDVLTSDKVKQYTDLVARKAAVVYRTIKEELSRGGN